MKRLILFAWLLLSAVAASAQESGPRAVFMGDSIFEGWGRTSPAFFSDNGFVNKGISGHTTARMLLRFQSDVLDLKPRTVVILAGTNDIARNDGVYVSVEKIRDNIAEMAVKAAAQGIEVVICSVLPCRYYRWRPKLHPEDEIIRLNQLLRQLAYLSGYIWVDFHSEMADEFKGLPPELSKDGCHPLKAGYDIMEDLLFPVIGGR